MNTKIILIMGLPGSGKTTLSKELLNHIDAEHFEADVLDSQKMTGTSQKKVG